MRVAPPSFAEEGLFIWMEAEREEYGRFPAARPERDGQGRRLYEGYKPRRSFLWSILEGVLSVPIALALLGVPLVWLVSLVPHVSDELAFLVVMPAMLWLVLWAMWTTVAQRRRAVEWDQRHGVELVDWDPVLERMAPWQRRAWFRYAERTPRLVPDLDGLRGRWFPPA